MPRRVLAEGVTVSIGRGGARARVAWCAERSFTGRQGLPELARGHATGGADGSGVRANLNRALFGSDTPSSSLCGLGWARSWSRYAPGRPCSRGEAPLAKLVALGKEVETLIKSCDAAVQKHSDATANLQAFLVNDWAPFVAKVNGERQLLGEAKKQPADGSEQGVGLFQPEQVAQQGDADSRAGDRGRHLARRVGQQSSAPSWNTRRQQLLLSSRLRQPRSMYQAQASKPGCKPSSRVKQAPPPPS